MRRNTTPAVSTLAAITCNTIAPVLGSIYAKNETIPEIIVDFLSLGTSVPEVGGGEHYLNVKFDAIAEMRFGLHCQRQPMTQQGRLIWLATILHSGGYAAAAVVSPGFCKHMTNVSAACLPNTLNANSWYIRTRTCKGKKKLKYMLR